MSHIYDLLIIGAGFAGVGAALEAKEQGASFLVLETANKAGGRVKTILTGRGAFNLGPNWDHLRKKSSLFPYIQKFGLEWKMDDAEGILIFNGKVDHSGLNRRFLETLEKNFNAAKKQNPKADGPFEQYLGNDPDLLAFAHAKRSLWCAGGRRNDVSTREFLGNPGGPGGIVLEKGMQALIDKFVEAIGPRKFKYNAHVERIDDKGGIVTVKTADGKIYRARKVIYTGSVDTLKKGRVEFTQGVSKKTLATLDDLTMGQMAKVMFRLKSLPPHLANGRHVAVVDKKSATLFSIGTTGKRTLSAIIGGTAANNIEKDWHRAVKLVKRKLYHVNRIPELKGIGKLITGKPIITPWGQTEDIGGAYSCWKVGSTPTGPLKDGNIIFAGEAFARASGHISGAFNSGKYAVRMASKDLRHAHRPRLRRPTIAHPLLKAA